MPSQYNLRAVSKNPKKKEIHEKWYTTLTRHLQDKLSKKIKNPKKKYFSISAFLLYFVFIVTEHMANNKEKVQRYGVSSEMCENTERKVQNVTTYILVWWWRRKEQQYERQHNKINTEKRREDKRNLLAIKFSPFFYYQKQKNSHI